ncbi:MAG: hypothetical protein ACREQ5_06690 [Candidatus Dormibacteria bacterium]
MPSVSLKQHRFFEAIKYNPKFAKKVGVSRSVADEFLTADEKSQDYKKGRVKKGKRKKGFLKNIKKGIEVD